MNAFDRPVSVEEVMDLIGTGKGVVVMQWSSGISAQPELLSAEETRRAQRFTHDDARQDFLAGRTLLHKVLAGFMEEVILSVGPHGKPECSSPGAPAFNLSHGGGVLLACFTPRGPVGVDVESSDRVPAHPDRLAEKVFTPAERNQLVSGQIDFVTLWTRKEAVLKAMGGGFSAGACSVSTEQMVEEAGWKLEGVTREGVTAAVCVSSEIPLVLFTGVC